MGRRRSSKENQGKVEVSDRLNKGDVVKVSQIVGHSIPLPAVGVIEYLTNSPSDPEWYVVRIKWMEHINETCCGCRQPSCQKEQRERLCDVRRDWMAREKE